MPNPLNMKANECYDTLCETHQPKPTTGAPACVLCGNQPHPDSTGHSYVPRSDQIPPAKPTDDWTAETVCELGIGKSWQAIADAHNAALTAEREKVAEYIKAANEVTDENIELEAKVQTLVDALQKILQTSDLNMIYALAEHQLAKVKEGK